MIRYNLEQQLIFSNMATHINLIFTCYYWFTVKKLIKFIIFSVFLVVKNVTSLELYLLLLDSVVDWKLPMALLEWSRGNVQCWMESGMAIQEHMIGWVATLTFVLPSTVNHVMSGKTSRYAATEHHLLLQNVQSNTLWEHLKQKAPPLQTPIQSQ